MNDRSRSQSLGKSLERGITLGQIFAAIISYAKWHSFWWMWLHGVFGWIYVIYFHVMGYHHV